MKFRNSIFVACFAALQLAATAHAEAPLWKSQREPIRDDQGRTQYMVSLTRDAADGFSDQVSDDLARRFSPRNTSKAKNMVASFERRYELEATDMTNWVGNTFTAYLTEEQVGIPPLFRTLPVGANMAQEVLHGTAFIHGGIQA